MTLIPHGTEVDVTVTTQEEESESGGHGTPFVLIAAGNPMQVRAIQQFAHEGLNDFLHFPFRTIGIFQKLADGAPLIFRVIDAIFPFVKKLTMLLTDVLLVFSAILDFHDALPVSFR